MKVIKKFFRYLRRKISRALKWLFVLLFLGLIINLFNSLSMLYNYPSPKVMTCAEFYANPLTNAWLKLTDCKVEMDNVALVSNLHMGVKVNELMVFPVTPKTTDEKKIEALLYIIHDDQELAKKLQDKDLSMSNETQLSLTKVMINYMGPEVTGLVLDKDKYQVTDTEGKVHKLRVYPFHYDAKPAWPINEALWALAMMGIFWAWRSWKGRSLKHLS